MAVFLPIVLVCCADGGADVGWMDGS